MKFETFQAGVWQQRYQYKSFEPVPVDHDWYWEDLVINALLEQANRALGGFSRSHAPRGNAAGARRAP